MNRIHSSHQSTSARAADRINIIIVEDNAVVCQGINIGGHNLIGAMKANIIPALLPNRHINVIWALECTVLVSRICHCRRSFQSLGRGCMIRLAECSADTDAMWPNN